MEKNNIGQATLFLINTYFKLSVENKSDDFITKLLLILISDFFSCWNNRVADQMKLHYIPNIRFPLKLGEKSAEIKKNYGKWNSIHKIFWDEKLSDQNNYN